jgi:hypothetical protein
LHGLRNRKKAGFGLQQFRRQRTQGRNIIHDPDTAV